MLRHRSRLRVRSSIFSYASLGPSRWTRGLDDSEDESHSLSPANTSFPSTKTVHGRSFEASRESPWAHASMSPHTHAPPFDARPKPPRNPCSPFSSPSPSVLEPRPSALIATHASLIRMLSCRLLVFRCAYCTLFLLLTLFHWLYWLCWFRRHWSLRHHVTHPCLLHQPQGRRRRDHRHHRESRPPRRRPRRS